MSTPTSERKYRWPEITGSMVVGFIVGFAFASLVAGFIAWSALNLRQAELAEEYGGLNRVVIATETIEAGEPLDPKKLASRALPRVVVSSNSLSPDEADPLFGKPSTIRFEKGDIVLRSAFGLPARAPQDGASAEAAD